MEHHQKDYFKMVIMMKNKVDLKMKMKMKSNQMAANRALKINLIMVKMIMVLKIIWTI